MTSGHQIRAMHDQHNSVTMKCCLNCSVILFRGYYDGNSSVVLQNLSFRKTYQSRLVSHAWILWMVKKLSLGIGSEDRQWATAVGSPGKAYQSRLNIWDVLTTIRGHLL